MADDRGIMEVTNTIIIIIIIVAGFCLGYVIGLGRGIHHPPKQGLPHSLSHKRGKDDSSK